jgi:DNA-binding LacI/PurR family transcriptional regulator
MSRNPPEPETTAADPTRPLGASRIARPQSLVVQVEQILREAIATRQFPGNQLPTEVEIADQLGVSRETVRRAAETLQREGLLVKFRRKGTFTHPDQLALQIRTRPSTLLGYLQADYQARGQEETATRTMSGLMLQGALAEADTQGFALVVRQTPHLRMGDAFQQLNQNARLRGVIFASYGEEKLLRRVAGLGLQTVLLDHDLHLPQISSVRDDSFEAARQAVRYLAELGHRRIAFANWHRTDLNPWRIMGYRQGLHDAKLPRRRIWELTTELTEAGARQVVEALLALKPAPTALYCFNNSLARQVIDELRRRGLRVPEDLSVVGAGGEDVPGLTCHQTDWFEVGRLAVQVLVRALAGTADYQPEHLLTPPVLRPGQTTAALGEAK